MILVSVMYPGGENATFDESYYLAKAAELNVLMDQLKEAFASLEDVQARVCLHYESIFKCWQRDVRWLNRVVSGVEFRVSDSEGKGVG